MTRDPRPLTDEEARALAKRWATEHEVKTIIDLALERAGVTPVHRRDLRRMTDSERERLFAWVRAQCDAQDFQGAYPTPVQTLASTLGWTEREGRPLAEAAGWPS